MIEDLGYQQDFKSKLEDAQAAAKRWEAVRKVQEAYRDPIDFAVRCMEALSFDLDPLQEDILLRMVETKHRAVMIQAQRGQAKSTLAAIAMVWDLIQFPHHRNIVVMPNSDGASQLITLCIRLFKVLPELTPFLPDRLAGDRTSVKAYDLHHSLKGPDKSPSLMPVSINESRQGKRSDFTVIDDIEGDTTVTAEQKATMLKRVLDFSAICQYRMVILGTPYFLDSMYFELPKKGVQVYVYPGRYPTPADVAFYGDTLAPWIRERLEANPDLATGGGFDGSRGQVTSPMIASEELHQAQELMGGQEWYELQFMLNATLSDAGRKPLKSEDILLVPHGDTFPMTMEPGIGPGFTHTHHSGGRTYDLTLPAQMSEIRQKPVIKAYIDPAAGGNTSRDRTAFTVIGQVGGNLVILSYGSVEGGYEEHTLKKLAEHLVPHKPAVVMIEKNMGFGAFTKVFQPILKAVGDEHGWNPGIEEDLVRTAKEQRIIDTLAPVMGRRSLWVTERALREESKYTEGLRAGEVASYSLWTQLTGISRTKGELKHDDALDSLAGCVNLFLNELAIDSNKKAELGSLKALKALEDAVLKVSTRKDYDKPLKRRR